MIKRKQPNAVKLGEGTFGQVVVESASEVRKIHDDLGCMLQETIVLRYMRGSPHIVELKAFNTNVPSVNIARWSCSLKDAMQKYRITVQQKMRIFRCVLMGLCHLHEAGILHSDLKISNILVDSETFEAYICDLGLSSLTKYARIRQTAPKYRPERLDFSHGHDMFGLCMSMVDLFGDKKINKICTSKELRGIIREMDNLPKGVRSTLIMMCPDEPKNSITPAAALKRLFNKETSFHAPKPTIYDNVLSTDRLKWLSDNIKKVSDKYGINRGLRCLEVMINFFNSPHGQEINTEYWKIYIAAAMFIYSSLFGMSKYNKEDVFASTHRQYAEDDLSAALNVLIMDDDFVMMTMI